MNGMINPLEKQFRSRCFVPCADTRQLLKPLALAVGRMLAQKVLLPGRRLENQPVSSNLHRHGLKRNMKNTNALKCLEVFERETSRRETQQPNLITKGRNQRQINE
ncbi:MAG TPA: hypothetical protein VMJ12_18810 [Candidatus Acidoferrales bacterium]|nr:hypothetical protein [Candidatus Acidoferrales bacterium]